MFYRLWFFGFATFSILAFFQVSGAEELILGSNASFLVTDEDSDSSVSMELEVKARKRTVRSSNAGSSLQLDQEQIAKLPQGSEISLPKLLSSTTPGIVLGTFGQTFVRGNHANVQYQLDGVQLPDSPSNTLGQAISPRNMDHVEIITGGIPAEYGQRLSAIVNVVTRSGPEKDEGEIQLNYGSYNTFSPHLLYGGSNESGNLHYFFSANYNSTDRGLDTPQPESYSNQDQGGVDSIHNHSIGNSEFAKVEWLADNHNKLTFLVFNTQNYFQIPTFPSSFKYTDAFFQPGFSDAFGNKGKPDSPTYNYVPTNTNDNQAETNVFGQVVWKHTFTERSFLQVAPYYKYSGILVTNDPANDLFSKNLIQGASPSSFSEDRHVNNMGLKVDYTVRPNDSHRVKMGFQVLGSRSEGTTTILTDLNLPPLVDSTPNNGFFEGVYIQDDFTLSPSLVLNLGLRYDAAQFSLGGGLGSSESLFQPRVGLNYFLAEDTKLHAFYGKLFQPAPVENLRYQFDPSTGTFSSLNLNNIRAEKDDYYEIGIAHQFRGLGLGLGNQIANFNVYYKEGIDVLDDAQILNTSIAQPFNFAQGYAYGAEFSIQGEISKDWSEYLNYSYGMAKGRGIGGVLNLNESYQFMDHVQLHTVNAGLTYSKSHWWSTVQIIFGSGLRTGVDNSLSLPNHFTVDTTLGYEFHDSSWLSRFKISGDILNVFDNRYPITIANGYNGSHYAVGRQYFVRLTREF